MKQHKSVGECYLFVYMHFVSQVLMQIHYSVINLHTEVWNVDINLKGKQI